MDLRPALRAAPLPAGAFFVQIEPQTESMASPPPSEAVRTLERPWRSATIVLAPDLLAAADDEPTEELPVVGDDDDDDDPTDPTDAEFDRWLRAAARRRLLGALAAAFVTALVLVLVGSAVAGSVALGSAVLRAGDAPAPAAEARPTDATLARVDAR